MNPMVVKYVGLAGVTYGIHVYLALAQLALGLFLIGNGSLLLSDRILLSKWYSRMGFRLNQQLRSPLISWLMILTGVALLLPLFGVTHLAAVVACPIAIYWIFVLNKDITGIAEMKTGNLARKILGISAIAIFGFTLWEGRDLVRAGFVVTYKAAYWDYKEVQGWQKTNNPNAPKVGALAPDFTLTDVQGKNSVQLSDFRGKRPVVLLFGSFT